MDYEAELAFIISRDAKDVPVEDAMGYVAGFTAGNDLTARKVQGESTQWGFSKGQSSLH
jgi:2-keto-4-pentenoate hydratase/2-oxohepta-3-ene-1,7-dioic acid hydratase in catechol pathway